MALMGSDQAKLDQNDQARAVLDWLSSDGAQNLLRQVAADRAQTADRPDIQRGQEEVQRRRDDAVHDWLNTPEAQRFLMGREDADIAMRQQAQRGPGTGAGPQPQPAPAPQSGGHWRPHPQRDRMIEGVLANQGGGFMQQMPRGQFAPPSRPSYQGPGYGPPGAGSPSGPPGGGGFGFMERAPQPPFGLVQPGSQDPRHFMGR